MWLFNWFFDSNMFPQRSHLLHYQSITHIVTVRVHEQQEGHSSTSCHRRLLTLVQICKSLWPKWEDGGARNKPGKNIFWIYPVFKWNVMYLFKEAPSSADSILLSGRLESTRDQLESTDADSHLRLQLSESSIHTQSGEASIRRRTVFSIIPFTLTCFNIHHTFGCSFTMWLFDWFLYSNMFPHGSSYSSSAEISSRDHDVLDGQEVDRSG